MTAPTALLIYPDAWLPRNEKEWGPLSAAACEVGFTAVVAGWEALAVEGDAVVASECLVRRPGEDGPGAEAGLRFDADIVLTTWGVKWAQAEVFEAILAVSGARHSEFLPLAWLDGKCELERCLRDYEARTGNVVPRPRTLVSDELAGTAAGGDDLVIVKPSRSGKCRGIEIVPRSATAALAEDAAAGRRPAFVVQDLIGDVFLYHGRRWDLRVQAMATSLAPLRFRLYREGVARTAAVAARPGSGRLEEWLNGTSFREDRHLLTEDVPVRRMLAYVEREHASLEGFWKRLEDLVGHVFAAIALSVEGSPHPADRAFLFPGFDMIVARRGDGYQPLLLEVNSHPGLDWEPHISAELAPLYRDWFSDLLALAPGDRAGLT